ncbi:MAG: hypothetical protein SGILL_002586 [Bacillariaceae sp.]
MVKMSFPVPVSPDILDASGGQINTFLENFLSSYNEIQSSPDLCDPLQRALDQIIGFDPDFQFQQEEVRRRALTAELVFLDEQNLERDLQESRANFTSRSNANVALTVSGTCSDCSASTPILGNDVTNRRHRRQLGSRNLNTCPPDAQQRPPTGDEYVLVFNDNNAASGLPFVTFDISQLEGGICPAPKNEMPTQSYSFELDVSPVSSSAANTNWEFYDALHHLTEEDERGNDHVFATFFNDWLYNNYCDPLSRYVTEVAFESSEIRLKTSALTFSIGGVCRGCVELFGDETVPSAPTVPAEPTNRRLRQPKRRVMNDAEASLKQQQQHRQLQGEQCWCKAGTLDRGPTQEEWEAQLTTLFLELSSTITNLNRLSGSSP